MNNIAKILREVIEKEEVSVYHVAKVIGVDISSLYRALKDEGNVGARTINKILDCLNYELRVAKCSGKEVNRSGRKRRSRKEVI